MNLKKKKKEKGEHSEAKNFFLLFFIYSGWSPAAKLVNQVGFHIFPVTGIVREQRPQSFYTDVMDGVSSLVEMVSDRLVSVVLYVSQVFLEAGVEGTSRFADVEFGAFGAMNNVHDVVRLAVELFGDVHHGFRSFDADVGADEGARFAFLLVARSGSWCFGGLLPKFRSH